MSTKRGRRNGRWLKEKSNRRLQEKRDGLYSKSRETYYEPLPKPIFAGWDITLEVTSGRKDSLELEQVAKVMKWGQSVFIRNIKAIKSIRKYGKSYQSYIKARESNYSHNNYIYERDYLKLPDSIKEYFTSQDTVYGVIHSLVWNFPFYALNMKVKKSYYYYKKVYDTEAMSEWNKLNSRLYLIDIKCWGGRYRDDYKKSVKSAWNNSMREIVSKQMSSEELLDYKYSKCWDKKNYGWS